MNANDKRIDELRKRIAHYFNSYGHRNMPIDIADEVKSMNNELETLVSGSEMERVYKSVGNLNRYMDDPLPGFRHPGNGGGSGAYAGKSLGDLFIESPAFKQYDPGRHESPSANFELKTLLDTTTWPPQSVRLPRIEPAPFPALTVLDAFSPGNTDQNSVVYLEESTSTSGAAETTEGDEKQESELVFTEREAPVRTIATVLPITAQLLDDVAACRDYVNTRLAFFVRQRLGSQLLNGDGAAPNLRGLLNVVGLQTQLKGTDPTPDAILKAMDKVRATGYEPDCVLLNPTDWQDIRLLRTADGQYIYGSPAERGPQVSWGVPVIASSAVPVGTGIVGCFKLACQPFFRQDMTIAVSDSHSDFFIRNKLMMRAECRVAFPVFRPAAFVQVTGI
jgi:hypothetical protein